MKEKKRLTASERQAFMNLVAARTALKYLEPLETRFLDIYRGRLMYRTARTLLTKLYEASMASFPEEQRNSIQRNINGLKYSLHVTKVNGSSTASDGFWASWDTLEAITEAVKDRCLMCTKDVQEQRKCLLAKALDELPAIKANNNARGCRYFNGLY